MMATQSVKRHIGEELAEVGLECRGRRFVRRAELDE
jgi:hypothetical protein